MQNSRGTGCAERTGVVFVILHFQISVVNKGDDEHYLLKSVASQEKSSNLFQDFGIKTGGEMSVC
jgi:hypothetical protein